MEIIAFKLKEGFMDVICKVEPDMVDTVLQLDFDTVKTTCPMFLHFVPMHDDNGKQVGHRPNLQPLNTLTDDPKSEEIYLRCDDIFAAFEISSEAENMYREVIGDLTVAKNDIITP